MEDDKLDKVIKGLTECIADLDCDDCPYENECFNADDDRQYGEQMMRDALELLKEQQKEIEKRTAEAIAYAELLVKYGHEFI